MVEFPDAFIEPSTVHLADQQLARALEAIRQSEHWVLLVPTHEGDPRGEIAVMASANGEFMVKALAAYYQSLHMVAEQRERWQTEDEAEAA